MHRYPFGVAIKDAIRGGRLRELYKDAKTPKGLPWAPEDFLAWLGLTVANPYTHFSPLRGGPKSEFDEHTVRNSLAKTVQTFLLLPAVLPRTYERRMGIEQATARVVQSIGLQAVSEDAHV
jgi:hypothetical protein